MELSQGAALWFLPFAAPVCLWVAWSDMASMKIPNKAVVTLAAIYALVGLIALPLTVYLWGWVHLVAVLVLGFVLNMGGALGAGDAKFAAAAAPFVATGDTGRILMLLAATLLAAFVTHRLSRGIGPVRSATGDWESWRRGDFPMGLALGGTLLFYLALAAVL